MHDEHTPNPMKAIREQASRLTWARCFRCGGFCGVLSAPDLAGESDLVAESDLAAESDVDAVDDEPLLDALLSLEVDAESELVAGLRIHHVPSAAHERGARDIRSTLPLHLGQRFTGGMFLHL